MPKSGGLISTAGALLVLGLAAAVVAIGWRWGSKQGVPGLSS